jgi:hypothetical protein
LFCIGSSGSRPDYATAIRSSIPASGGQPAMRASGLPDSANGFSFGQGPTSCSTQTAIRCGNIGSTISTSRLKAFETFS